MTTTTAAFAPDDLRAIAERMRDLDICMLTTRDGDAVATRPMSNNGQVEFDGDTWFFAERDSAKVRQIEAEPAVGHRATSRPSAGPGSSMEAEAEIVDDDGEKRERWFEDLRRWFPDGPDADTVVLIRARATRVRAWGADGDLDVRRGS